LHERDRSRWRCAAALVVVILGAYGPQVWGQAWPWDHTWASTTTSVTDPTGYVTFRHIDSFIEGPFYEGNEWRLGWNPGGTWGLEIGPRFGTRFGWPIAGRKWVWVLASDGSHPNFAYTGATAVAVDTDGSTGPNAQVVWNYWANLMGFAHVPEFQGANTLENLLVEPWTQRDARTVEGEWRIPVDTASTLTALQWVLVRERYTIMRDTLRIEYFVKNDTAGPPDPITGVPTPPGIPMAVGIRNVMDTTFGEIQSPMFADDTDGQPIYVTPARPPVTTDFLFADTPGSNAPPVPEVWQSFQKGSAAGTTGVILKGTLAGQDTEQKLWADSVAGRPDQLQIGRIVSVASNDYQFDFTPLPVSFLNRDWAVAVRWDVPPLPDLAVGKTRRFVTYYGLGDATSDFVPSGVGHYVLALQSPLGLQVVHGDDPSTAAVEDYFYTVDAMAPGANGIIPLRAFANNVDRVPVDVGSVSVSVPPTSGLVFVDSAGAPIPGAGSTITVPIGTLPAGTEGPGDLYIRAPAGIPPGVYQIRGYGPGKMVERPLSIPSIPQFGIDRVDVVRRLNMMSVPYQFVDADAEHILGTLQPPPVDPTVHALGLARYDPLYMGYRYWPNPFILTVQPGQGFWVYNPPSAAPPINLITLPAPPERSEVSAPGGYAIMARKGWNQIGTPFTVSGMWNQTEFQAGVGQRIDFSTAVTQGLLLPVIFWYDINTADYAFNADPNKVALDPWVGYWLYCYRDLNVIFMPPNPVVGRSEPVRVAAEPRVRQVGAHDWRVELAAAMPGVTRAGRVLGVGPGAADGFDANDIMDPPPPESPEGYLVMFFPHSDWGQFSGQYRWDLRGPITDEKTWDVMVQTNRPNEEVTLSWPNLRELPKECGIVLRDVDANVSRSMRTTTLYRYNSGVNAGARHFQVVVSAQQLAAPQITGFQFVPAKGRGGRGDVLFHVNMDCVVDLSIRNITGRLVKALSKGQQFTAGQHSVYWDGTNDWGAVVPNGTYLGEIVARTEGGERANALSRFVVLR